ncbi:hypothetical protein CLG96_12520 [Sphingomonas oleivorans]|uniref:Uncharacterized protein n=1 Tax=Sphingomonas oleivorans TaxID=1735121 RepID=A0A2T5FW33_9SPHN|nr:hypothetical protein [Sphingomonas oleivorans]PTQ09969.1 hypothetical protein CLG96_12520 [Sphingomonas oleivorans]
MSVQSLKSVSVKSLACLLALPLTACATDNQFDETGGVRVTRSACPAVAIPAYTGDVTLFSIPQSRDARALDVSATITNLRSTCTETGDQLVANATFEIQARRASASGAREVILPYFATVMRGGTRIMSKQIGRVALRFEDGQLRASTGATATASISRAAATIPPEVEAKINRKRKPTDPDASIDPMADPTVRAAVQEASFELLVGFQLTNDQLAYNATR